jgi:hypothetical protein
MFGDFGFNYPWYLSLQLWLRNALVEIASYSQAHFRPRYLSIAALRTVR